MRAYLYREGDDFVMPPELAPFERERMEPPDGVLLEKDGSRRLDPAFFSPAAPDKAEVFLFPYDLGHFVNFLREDGCAVFLRRLPHFSGNERRHVFSDNGDIAGCPPLPSGFLKRSLLRSWGQALAGKPHVFTQPEAPSPRCIVTWYELPAHVAADKPHFDWHKLRYDCSFVGAYSHVLRNAACTALEREPALRFYNGGFDSIIVCDNTFFHKEQPEEEKARRRELFRRVTKDSLMVLCPPGVGPQSVRMYETMYYGRIPLLFTTQARYPLEDRVPYSAFCYTIAESDVLRSGEIVRGILASHNEQDLHARCALACKTWNRHFSNAGRAAAMAGFIRELAGMD